MPRFYFCRQLRGLAAGLALLGAAPLARAQSTSIPGPVGSGAFGTTVTVLPNGNFVVTDPLFDLGAVTDVGAVYLYDGATNALISTLTGSTANDRVGSRSITVLADGNFVVSSLDWTNAAGVPRVGAVTWGSATVGVSGVVSVANSLVGSSLNDEVGIVVTPLPNGSYVVDNTSWDNGTATDAGAVTWRPGGGPAGDVVSAANSLVGTTPDDLVGGANVLANGNYVVLSPGWDNGPALDAGAATWGSATGGVSGVVSAANSLVGTHSGDYVGGYNFTALPSGNYLVYAKT